MNAQEQVQQICEILQALGQPGSAHQVAQILAMSPSSIARYLSGEVTPRSHPKESIGILHRILVETHEGNEQAKRILDAVLGQKGLLRAGLGGVLIAAGMTWVVYSSKRLNPRANNPDRPTTRNSTEPSKQSRKRAKDRRPSKNG